MPNARRRLCAVQCRQPGSRKFRRHAFGQIEQAVEVLRAAADLHLAGVIEIFQRPGGRALMVLKPPMTRSGSRSAGETGPFSAMCFFTFRIKGRNSFNRS